MPFEPISEPWIDGPDILVARRPPITPDPKRVWYKRRWLWLLTAMITVLWVCGIVIEAMVGVGIVLFFFWIWVSGAESMFGGGN